MHPDLPSFGALATLSIREPRRAARHLMALGVPVRVRWQVLGVVATVSAVILHLELQFAGTTEQSVARALLENPLATALGQGLVLLAFVVIAHRVGQALGGQGGFADALLLLGWIQVLMLCLSVVQLGLLLIAPALANILGVIGLGLFLWLLVNFIAELHGFASLATVAVGMVATFLLAGLALAMLLAPFLPTPPIGG